MTYQSRLDFSPPSTFGRPYLGRSLAVSQVGPSGVWLPLERMQTQWEAGGNPKESPRQGGRGGRPGPP